jgi:hypothetical protein
VRRRRSSEAGAEGEGPQPWAGGSYAEEPVLDRARKAVPGHGGVGIDGPREAREEEEGEGEEAEEEEGGGSNGLGFARRLEGTHREA